MLQKLKEKKSRNKLNWVYAFCSYFVIVFLGILIFQPQKAQASCTTGSFFSPTQYTCDQSTVSLTVSPSTFNIGDSVTFTITVNDNVGLNSFTFKPLTDPKTFQLSANDVQVFTTDVPANFGGTFTIKQTITAPAFPSSGSYTLAPTVIFKVINAGDQPNTSWSLSGPTTKVNVGASTSTGLQVSKISQSISTLDSNQVQVNYGVSYSGGTMTSFTYDCGNGQGVKTPANATPNSFICNYGTAAKTYPVTVVATLSNGSTVTSSTSAVITGTESSQGAGEFKEIAMPF